MSEELSDIRKKAMQILDGAGIPPLGQQINSDGATEAKFSELTGGAPISFNGKQFPSRHALLADNWSKGGIMTACNEFVGWYGRKLGIKEYLGRFDIATYLPTIGKGQAWVKSTADRQPKPGDILRHTAYHMDVAIDFQDGVLYRVAAGQGGKGVGHDILKRVKGDGPYDYKKLTGWVDLDLFFGSPPGGPVPQWLLGWWQVTWRRQVYYYHFDSSHQAQWTQVKPLIAGQGAVLPSDTATFTVEGNLGVTIRWGTGSVEKLSKVDVTSDQQMQGTWNGHRAARRRAIAILA